MKYKQFSVLVFALVLVVGLGAFIPSAKAEDMCALAQLHFSNTLGEIYDTQDVISALVSAIQGGGTPEDMQWWGQQAEINAGILSDLQSELEDIGDEINHYCLPTNN